MAPTSSLTGASRHSSPLLSLQTPDHPPHPRSSCPDLTSPRSWASLGDLQCPASARSSTHSPNHSETLPRPSSPGTPGGEFLPPPSPNPLPPRCIQPQQRKARWGVGKWAHISSGVNPFCRTNPCPNLDPVL